MIEFADPTAKLNALLGGTVDYVTLVDASQASVVQSTPGYEAPRGQDRRLGPLHHARRPEAVRRRARASGVPAHRRPPADDRPGQGRLRVGRQRHVRAVRPRLPEDLPQRVQDLEQAKSLLKQAGYDNNLTVELTCSTATGAGDVQAAQVFAQQAKGAGVTVNVKQGRPERLLRRRLPQVDLRHGLLGHAQLPAADAGRHAPGAPSTTRRTGTTPSGWRSSTRRSRRSTTPSATSSSPQAEHDRVRARRLHHLRVQRPARRLQRQARRASSPTTGARSPPTRCRFNLMYFV